MTNYGTIPTSTSPPVNLDYISRAKERVQAGLGTRRPWRQMFDRHCFSFPKGFHDAVARVKTNVAYFRMNYALVVLLILFLSLLWHPISLLVFIAMMAVWLFLYFFRDEPLVVFRRTISDRTVVIVLSVLTIFVLLLTHATINIVVAVLTGVVVVVIHAAVRKTDDLLVDEESDGGFLRPSGGSSSS
ncbi:hypothetical protein ACJIZ3_020466 [Penstemon smallii]|uniref:PRA1 family protein n=1 Tax=Penstemon smallii TaxID=265156 RepID=A0ABD3SJF5_9LAMI